MQNQLSRFVISCKLWCLGFFSLTTMFRSVEGDGAFRAKQINLIKQTKAELMTINHRYRLICWNIKIETEETQTMSVKGKRGEKKFPNERIESDKHLSMMTQSLPINLKHEILITQSLRQIKGHKETNFR